jgi:type VI protein secretion system component Hcp
MTRHEFLRKSLSPDSAKPSYSIERQLYRERGSRKGGADMAEYYLKIEGVEGDARRDEHAGEVWLDAVTLSVFNEPTAAPDNRSQHTINISLNCQPASVRLMTAAAAGEKFKQAVLTMYSHPGPHQQRMRYVLSNARVQSYHSGGSVHGDFVAMDNFVLVFSKFEVELSRAQEDRSFGPPTRGGFDFVSLQAVGDPSKY